MNKKPKYKEGDRVEYMSATQARMNGTGIRGLLKQRIGIIKRIERKFFTTRYYILRLEKDGAGAMDVCRERNIFGIVEKKENNRPNKQ